MAISASMVKELRERTGAGMMECKRALQETDGDIEAAIEAMRKSGQAKAAKKAGRIAADGVIVLDLAADGGRGIMVEINSETDFVAKDANFIGFADAVGATALASDAADIGALAREKMAGGVDATVDAAREALVAKVGENVQLRRIVRFDAPEGTLCSYRHGVRIGVIVDLIGGSNELGKDVAMHIAATNPMCISAEDVPPEALEKEREIFRAQALESGKPPEIVDKIIGGRMRKFTEEVTLLGQAFVKDPDVTIEKLLQQSGAKVASFARLEVGEGIEKKTENFAEEVQAQAQQAE